MNTMKPNEKTLSFASGAFGRPFYLVHVSEGTEIAGSGIRQQHECYRVVSFDRDGTRHGHAFKTLDEAKGYFEQYTTPIYGIPA